MPTAPLPPEKLAEIDDLKQAIREAIDTELNELAANLATTDDAHLFGDNEFKIRAIAHKIAAKAFEQHLARKKTTIRVRARTRVILDSVAPDPPEGSGGSSWIAPSS
jgi:hypothetical protein